MLHLLERLAQYKLLHSTLCTLLFATPYGRKLSHAHYYFLLGHAHRKSSIQSPNLAHKAIAELEARLKPQGRSVTVITQNIDRLHHKAGSESVVELHGKVKFISNTVPQTRILTISTGCLFRTRCTKCGDIDENNESPICPALKDKG